MISLRKLASGHLLTLRICEIQQWLNQKQIYIYIYIYKCKGLHQLENSKAEEKEGSLENISDAQKSRKRCRQSHEGFQSFNTNRVKISQLNFMLTNQQTTNLIYTK